MRLGYWKIYCRTFKNEEQLLVAVVATLNTILEMFEISTTKFNYKERPIYLNIESEFITQFKNYNEV